MPGGRPAAALDRKSHHLAFGISNHFCLGVNLARMELRVALTELLARLPDMQFAGEGPVVRPHSLVGARAEMQVQFSPRTDLG